MICNFLCGHTDFVIEENYQCFIEFEIMENFSLFFHFEICR